MAIQHKSIPEAELHEPKGVSLATAKQVYVADGAGSGDWRRVKESDFDYSAYADNVFGWNDIADSLYTSGSPRAITSGTRTKLTNNGLGVQTTQARLGSIWSTGTNSFTINEVNSSFILRAGFKATAAAAAGTPYTIKLELESSNGPLVIFAQDSFLKGGGYVNDFAISVPFYIGSVVNNYPLSLYVTPDTNINLYNVGFVIQRLYKET